MYISKKISSNQLIRQQQNCSIPLIFISLFNLHIIKYSIIISLFTVFSNCTNRNSNNTKDNSGTNYAYDRVSAGDEVIVQEEASTSNIFEYIIPDNVDKNSKEYMDCRSKLDKLQESVKEYKKADKEKIVLSCLPSIMNKMWYCEQTAGAARKKVTTIDEIVSKGPIEAGGVSDEDLSIYSQEQLSEEYKEMYAKVLFGKKDFNEYLKTVIEGDKSKPNHNGHWYRFVDDKLNWIGTLIINKQRTVVNNDENLDVIFKGNKELQQLMKENVEKQHDFFDSYVHMVKIDKKACVESLCKMKNLPETASMSDEEKSRLYFKSLVLNCKENLDSFVKTISQGEDSSINSTLSEVYRITDEYLAQDPEGEALAEFTKIIFSKSSIFSSASSYMGKKKEMEDLSRQSHTSAEMADKAIGGMKKLKQGITLLSAFILVGYRGSKDVSRSKAEVKAMKVKLKLFINLLKIYLEFGISLTEYLKNCDRTVLAQRLTKHF